MVTQERDWNSPLSYQPGTDWCYSTGLDWAGKVVEKVSKKSLEEFMQEYIWMPLGMKNTTFHPERREVFPMLAMGTRRTPNAPLVPGELIYPIPAQNEAGGAGIFSNCEDYAKLLAALLRDDCPILKKESIEELVKPQLSHQSQKGLERMRTLGVVLPEIPNNIRTDYALAGLYLEDPIPGGRSKGTVTWDGMCSPNWVSIRKCSNIPFLYRANAFDAKASRSPYRRCPCALCSDHGGRPGHQKALDEFRTGTIQIDSLIDSEAVFRARRNRKATVGCTCTLVPLC
jgi:CubicO group peptidase (beta-lactamase class C family)